MKLSVFRRRLEAECREASCRLPEGELSGTEADSILAARFGLDITGLLLHGDMAVNDADIDACEAQLSRVIGGEPLQYVTGRAPFMGRYFTVDRSVLIPRLDTETLYAEAEKRVRMLEKARTDGEPLRVLDMCTGSGIIAVTLKAEHSELDVTAADISEEALRVAASNARRHGAGNIRFIASDLFERVPLIDSRDRFDLIVSNPPYVSAEELPGLPSSVKDYEPDIALYGGADGLDFYRKIVGASRKYLAPGGWLCFEIGDTQTGKVSALMDAAGLTDITVTKDLAERDRVVCGARKE